MYHLYLLERQYGKFLMIGLALVIGLGAGFGAVLFRYLIDFITRVSFVDGKVIFSSFNFLYILLIPAIGGLIVGPLTYFLAREAKGHGVPEVMAAVTFNKGRIRPRVIFVKSLASAITIGTGGSAGREGPIVQIGSGIGSALGQLLKLSAENIRLLVACGAAGGISATFNAPIAGTMFGLEIILGKYNSSYFIPTIVSSVTAASVSRSILGDSPAFRIPPLALNSYYELVLFAVLGVVGGLFAILYIKTLYGIEDVFDKVTIPPYVKPALGGLIVGLIGVFYPQVMGTGYEFIESAIAGKMGIALLAVLCILKLLATSFSIGSGGSGGVFAPGLFMGAMLGGTFGYVFHSIFGGGITPIGAYALAGMGAIFAATAHAPLTAIIMLFELTDGYHLILPIMITCGIATLVSTHLHKESIYTVKLKRRGLDILSIRESELNTVRIKDIMTEDVVFVEKQYTISQTVDKMRHTGHFTMPVMDNGNMVGIIAYKDIVNAIINGNEDDTIGKYMTKNVVTIWPEATLREALLIMGDDDISKLPVMEDGKLVGIVSRNDILKASHTIVKAA
ncbi:chloride channel protein [Calorimonas adulescens]|uniref:CBS domain-containing protein n=1 Tax=Calorimonas adulescens TaxID=2606906 RepID=A0A5D8Q8A8_9THEO|nr:chloride channel protein [Calorimonas adulescens]TZE81005.1 CBS domain-containing protein [Calorimonas adulescens]